jgi:hypothetical protein
LCPGGRFKKTEGDMGHHSEDISPRGMGETSPVEDRSE